MWVFLVLLSLLRVDSISANDPVKFYWIGRTFDTKDTQCTGFSIDSFYMTNLNLGKDYGGEGKYSDCIKAGNSRFYTVWCDASNGVVGAQEFISSDCSDSRFLSNPEIAGNRGGKTVYTVVKGECFYDPSSGYSIKSEGCFVDQAKVPSNYRHESRASRISHANVWALLSFSTLLFVRGSPK